MRNPTFQQRRRTLPGNDRALRVRPLAAKDKEKLRAMSDRLSEKTVYLRFHMPYPGVPEWAIDHLSNARLHGTESFVAVAEDEIVGQAMYVREGGNEAEMAVIVEDEWQSKGVGKILLFRLTAQARSRGIETFTATVLGENRRMLGLLDAVFAGVDYRKRDGVYQVRVPLSTLKPVSKREVIDLPRDARLEGEFIPPIENYPLAAVGKADRTVFKTTASSSTAPAARP